jgi:hypothetical protein
VADNDAAVSAVAPKEGCSEIVGSPIILLRLLEPLQRTLNAALIFRNATENVTASISASSFHHSDGQADRQTNNNAILQATSASLLKSETACCCEEFDEFDFRSDRDVEEEDVPDDVNEEVILVFSMKEAKAVLDFCNKLDLEQRVALSFHWGGKPLTLETRGTESFSMRLVLATLEYKLLTSMRTVPDNRAPREGEN